jgi:hypothetical protein
MKQQHTTTGKAIISKEDKLPDIDLLTREAERLGHLVDWWNTAMVVTLVFTALAAAAVLVTTYMGLKRASQKDDVQSQLLKAKDKKLALDLREKDLEIFAAKTQAATAEAETLKLRRQTEARRLTGEQKTKLTKLLSAYGGTHGVAIVSAMIDPESSDFADDFDVAIKDAKWETVRILNRISSKYGVAVLTVEGTILPGVKQLGDALTSVGIEHEVIVLKSDDKSINSTSPAFQAGYLYLVVEHKPLPKSAERKLVL